MIPHDLRAARVSLPAGDRGSLVLLTDGRSCHLRAGYLIQRRFPGLISGWWIWPPRPAVEPAGTLAATLTEASRALRRSHGVLAQPGQLRGAVKSLRRRLQAHTRRSLARSLHMAVRGHRELDPFLVDHELARMRAAAAVQPSCVGDANQVQLAAELAALAPYFLVSLGNTVPPVELSGHARGLVIHARIDCWPAHEGDPDFLLDFDVEPPHRRLDHLGASVHIVDPLTGAMALARRSTVALHADDTMQRGLAASVALASQLLVEVLASARAADELLVFPSLDFRHEARLAHHYVSKYRS